MHLQGFGTQQSRFDRLSFHNYIKIPTRLIKVGFAIWDEFVYKDGLPDVDLEELEEILVKLKVYNWQVEIQEQYDRLIDDRCEVIKHLEAFEKDTYCRVFE